MTNTDSQPAGYPTHPTEPPRAPRPTDDLSDGWARAWRVDLPATVVTSVPCTVDEVLPALVTCADPFRGGNRVDSHSVTRLHTKAGRLTGPGPLLPATGDDDIDAYARRVTAGLDGEGWMLRTQNPFATDYSRWASLRERLAALWHQVGWPSAPLDVELTVGNHYRRLRAAPSDHAQLTWVLSGGLQTEVATARPQESTQERRLTADAGQGLFVPAGYEVTETYGAGCVLLRVTVPMDPRTAFTVVRDDLRSALLPEESALELPYLPHPHASDARSAPAVPARPAGRSGPVDIAVPLTQVADRLRQTVTAPHFAHALRKRWATCRSAAGLRPAPQLGSPSTLDYRSEFRVRTEILTIPDGGDGTLWAVNGHLLPVGGAAAKQISAALPPGLRSSAREICRALGAGDEHPGVLRLLRALHQLRALDVLDQDEREERA